jgi:tRNA threonylcarbamoyladenosine biosynthesis protein TsaE
MNLAEMKKHAEDFVNRFPQGCRVGLVGELGAGKTTWVRFVVDALNEGNSQRVTSPSFTLHCSYSLKRGFVEHFDLYRLEKATESELVELGYFAALEKSQSLPHGFLFVEWPEKAKNISLLGMDYFLNFKIVGDQRELSLLSK